MVQSMRRKFFFGISTSILWISNILLLHLAIDATISSDRSITENALLNSDALYAHMFARDFFEGNSLNTWQVPRSPDFFPDFLFVILAVSLARVLEWEPIQSVYLAACLMGLSWTLVYSWFFYRLSEILGIRLSSHVRDILQPWHAAPLGTSVIFLLIAVDMDSGVFAIIFVPTFHAGCLLLFPSFFLLSVKILVPDVYRAKGSVYPTDPPNQRVSRSVLNLAQSWGLPLFCLFLVLVATISSESMFVLICVLPVLASLPFLLYVRLVSARTVLMYSAVVLVGLYCAILVRDYFNELILITGFDVRFEKLFESEFLRIIPDILEDLVGLASEPAGALFIVVLFAFLGVLVQTRFFRVPSARNTMVQWIILIQGLILLLSIAGMIVVGYTIYRQPIWIRLAIPGLLVSFLFSAFLVTLEVIHRLKKWMLIPFLTLNTYLFLSGVGLFFSQSGVIAFDAERYSQSKSIALAKCLGDLQHTTGRYGLSDYWVAKSVTFLTDGNVHVNQLAPHLAVSHWVSNYEWYYTPHSDGGYGFIVTDRLDRSKILAVFGSPASIQYCEQTEIFIYDRSTDSMFRDYFSPADLDLWLLATGRVRN